MIELKKKSKRSQRQIKENRIELRKRKKIKKNSKELNNQMI